ncbi:transcription elongation factor GreB [Sphingorhabdus sp.]|uniref:transcription elongation factor GreB n=1 Tax=Sphingorhabdus sp. TaxID=1902408 RepID=UPI0032B76F85
MSERTNPITPQGFASLRAEYEQLFAVERPKVVEIVSWAAGNGDRSENGDYIYGRQRLREIDRKLGRLSKQMKFAKVIDPSHQDDRSQVYFGSTVVLADEDDNQRSVTIVGDDEADATAGRIGWNSPLAKALRGARLGDLRTVQLPSGPKEWEIVGISYPD